MTLMSYKNDGMKRYEWQEALVGSQGFCYFKADASALSSPTHRKQAQTEIYYYEKHILLT